MIRYKLTIYDSETNESLAVEDSYLFEDLEVANRRFIENYAKTQKQQTEDTDL